MGFDHVLLENVQFPSAQNGKQDFGSTDGRDRSAQLAADIAAWDARFEGSVTLWYGYSLGQVTEGASTVGGSATALGVRNLVVEVPAKQTMDDTARSELRNTCRLPQISFQDRDTSVCPLRMLKRMNDVFPVYVSSEQL